VHAVRKRILEILKEIGGATVAELAEQLDMAPVSVRHHLDILQGDNLICVDRLERKGNVGRPQQVYALTEDANEYFPDNFAALATHLVRQMKQVLPEADVQAAFCSMAQTIAQELDVDLDELAPEDRLDHVTEFLNARGYLARWEYADGADGPAYLLHKHNCPYAGVSDEHTELCAMDKTLVDTLLGQSSERTQTMVGTERCCTYRVDLGIGAAAGAMPHLILTNDIAVA
jgi:predicted ArsR family transcriptional regulator